MSESRLKENAAAVRKLFGTAAKLAQKQAALATLNNVTLPKLYHAIGKKIVGLEKLPPDLVPHREKIRALEAGIAAKPEEPQAAPAEGFAAKAKQFAQQAAHKASKATADAAATMQIQAAYVSLGKNAVEQYGEKAVPKDIAFRFRETQDQISHLSTEIRMLNDSARTGVVTPQRVLVAGTMLVALLLIAFLLPRFETERFTAKATERAAGESLSADTASSVAKDNTGTVAASEKRPVAPASVKRRSFSGPSGLTDEQLRTAIAEGPDITNFQLSQCRNLTDRALEALSDVDTLLELTLCQDAVFSAKGFKALKGRPLDSIYVPTSLLNDPDAFATYVSLFRPPAGPPPQESATSGNTDFYTLDVGDAGLSHLRGVRGVKSIHLPKGTTDRGLAMLSKCPDLQILYVVLNTDITDKGIASLRGCEHLRELYIHDSRISPNSNSEKQITSSVGSEGIRSLKGMRLEHLALPLWMMEEDAFEPFLDALTEDSEERCWNDDGVNRCAVKIRSVSSPNPETMASWPNTPKVFAALPGKRGIKMIFIRDCTCREEDLRKLGDIPDLLGLSFERVTFDGAGLDTLGRARNLNSVQFDNCPTLTDAGLRGIGKCASLNHLDLLGSPLITDEGLMAVAKGCPLLKRLSVRGTGASGAVIVKLENALPECDVEVSE